MFLAVLFQSPTLSGPFTLVYREMVSDVRPQAVKERALAAVRDDLDARVRAGALSADAAALALRNYRKTLDAGAAIRTLTLSYDGRTLLVEDAATATLVTKMGALRLTKGATDGVRGVWSKRPELGLPFFGAHLPLLPPFAAKSVRDASGAVTKVVAGGVTTSLSAHALFRGSLLAHRIVRADEAARTEYAFVFGKPSALPAERFQAERYVQKGDEIALPGRPNLIFDPAKGDLMGQIAALSKS